MSGWMGYTNVLGYTIPVFVTDEEFKAMIELSNKTQREYWISQVRQDRSYDGPEENACDR